MLFRSNGPPLWADPVEPETEVLIPTLTKGDYDQERFQFNAPGMSAMELVPKAVEKVLEARDAPPGKVPLERDLRSDADKPASSKPKPRALSQSEIQYFEVVAPGFSKLGSAAQAELVNAFDVYSRCCPGELERARNEFLISYQQSETARMARGGREEGSFTVFDCESNKTRSTTVDLHEPAA